MKTIDKTISYWSGTEDKEHACAGESQSIRRLSAQISSGDVCRFARQLQTLLQAGLALAPALKAMEEEFAEAPIGRLVKVIRTDVESGKPLVDSLSRFPELFSQVFISMIAAAHTSGKLEEALESIVIFMEKRQRLASALKAAAAYPIVTTVVAFAVVSFLLSYVVPNIAQIFTEMDHSLPAATIALIALSNFLRDYLIFIIVGVVVVVMSLAALLKNPDRKESFDRFKLSLPVLGKLFRKSETARICRTLGTLLATDVPLINALQITEPVTHNCYVRKSLTGLRQNIEKGRTVAESVGRIDFFSPLVYHMLSAGQLSGKLEDSLNQIAEMYEEEVETATKVLTSLFEPAMLIVMGVVIAFIVTAILLPVLEMNQLF